MPRGVEGLPGPGLGEALSMPFYRLHRPESWAYDPISQTETLSSERLSDLSAQGQPLGGVGGLLSVVQRCPLQVNLSSELSGHGFWISLF